MESLEISKLDEIAFKAINQNGNGDLIDQYIYSQSGEGLASFLGGLAKKAIPIFGNVIKEVAKVAVPHLQDAVIAGGTDIVKTAFDNVPEKLSKRTLQEMVNLVHIPHKQQANGL